MSRNYHRTHAKRPTAIPHRGCRRGREGTEDVRECSANSQCSLGLHCLSTVRLYVVHLASQHLLSETKRQAGTAPFRGVSLVIDATRVRMCKRERWGYGSYSRWWRTASEGTTLPCVRLRFTTTRAPPGMFPGGALLPAGGRPPCTPRSWGACAAPHRPPRWRRRQHRAASTRWRGLRPCG